MNIVWADANAVEAMKERTRYALEILVQAQSKSSGVWVKVESFEDREVALMWARRFSEAGYWFDRTVYLPGAVPATVRLKHDGVRLLSEVS